MNKIADLIKKPFFIPLSLSIIVGIGLLVWYIKKIQKPPNPEPISNKKTMFSATTENKPSSGAHTVMRSNSEDVIKPGKCVLQEVTMNLPAPLNNSEVKKQYLFNSDDINIDPRILQQWALHEIPYQENNTMGGRTGQVWLKNWEALGPIDPFVPRHESSTVTPGPTDPQLAYANTLVASMDAQAEKFCVTENPNDITYQYRNSLQQLPGSHFQTDAASWDAYETPQVIDRFSHLAKVTAAWVVEKLNEKMRKEHPCFSLSGREHFELSNPPLTCGDTSNPKYNPITLIRVFESRLKRVQENESQLVYLTLELGNHIAGGAGGMFQTIVTVDNKGNIVNYTTPDRDEKQSFVLPRTR